MDTTDPHALVRLHARIAGIRTIAGQGELHLDRAETLLSRLTELPTADASGATPHQDAAEATELVRETRRILRTILDITRPLDRPDDPGP